METMDYAVGDKVIIEVGFNKHYDGVIQRVAKNHADSYEYEVHYTRWFGPQYRWVTKFSLMKPMK